mmetsp:Transcript_11779/g.27297  ORF Transcript_11779/g.27297 Transcript_11779/m.27297 type:complete len:208 (-) Transcript_11779:1805-2428(-)
MEPTNIKASRYHTTFGDTDSLPICQEAKLLLSSTVLASKTANCNVLDQSAIAQISSGRWGSGSPPDWSCIENMLYRSAFVSAAVCSHHRICHDTQHNWANDLRWGLLLGCFGSIWINKAVQSICQILDLLFRMCHLVFNTLRPIYSLRKHQVDCFRCTSAGLRLLLFQSGNFCFGFCFQLSNPCRQILVQFGGFCSNSIRISFYLAS